MDNYDIVYIKGNPSSGTPLQHDFMNNSILELINDYSYKSIESNEKNLSGVKIPESKIYIGFSRGSRYLKKLNNNSLKISIGGISGSKIQLFKNKNDNILLGDMTNTSLAAHFIIEDTHKVQIKALLSEYLK